MGPHPLWRVVTPALARTLRLASWSAIRATGQPFSRPWMLKPYAGGHRYGWSHYGVMIPDLPEPHRYFSTMIIAGLPGATAFDNDAAVTTSPRDTATVSVSTAAPAAAMFGAYSMAEQCHLEPDGSRLEFGGSVTIEGRYPSLRISTAASDFRAELSVTGTDQAAWFVRTPVYDHLSLLARYDGWIAADGERAEVATVGTFEYAACVGMHGLLDRPFGGSAKVPVDFFTYHVVAVDERTQLLLVEVHAADEPVATMAYHRSVGGSTWVTHRGVRFEVTEYATTTTTDPFGNRMRLPVSFRWTAGRDLTVEGAVDTPPRFGVGRGYILGYQCHGHFQGRAFESRGYMEYVDTEAADRASPDFLARPG